MDLLRLGDDVVNLDVLAYVANFFGGDQEIELHFSGRSIRLDKDRSEAFRVFVAKHARVRSLDDPGGEEEPPLVIGETKRLRTEPGEPGSAGP